MLSCLVLWRWPCGSCPSGASAASGDAEVELLEHLDEFAIEFDDEGKEPKGPKPTPMSASERRSPAAFFQVTVPNPSEWKALAGDSQHVCGGAGSAAGGLLVKRHYVASVSPSTKAVRLSLQPAALQTSDGDLDSLLLLLPPHLQDLRVWKVVPCRGLAKSKLSKVLAICSPLSSQVARVFSHLHTLPNKFFHKSCDSCQTPMCPNSSHQNPCQNV